MSRRNERVEDPYELTEDADYQTTIAEMPDLEVLEAELVGPKKRKDTVQA